MKKLKVEIDNGKSLKVVVRFEKEVDIEYLRNGGILK
jgi:aconitase A